MSDPVMELTGVSKRFDATQALADVSLTLYPGETHALLGENGAGKSTLIKVMTGIHAPDAGVMRVNGEETTFKGSGDAQKAGVAAIYQEPAIFPDLNVAENIFMSHQDRGGLVRWQRMYKDAEVILARIDVRMDVRTLASTLTVASQQAVEIAKALSLDTRVLIMDEPTAALSAHEVSELFTQIRRLTDSGVAVLLASHLLGADRAVAIFGGGNTSAKGRAVDHVGREVDVMWVKGSGSDLASMRREDFTPLRLDEALAVFGREEMSDEEMVAHLARCQVDPAAPRSSIETLLHAFVPFAHVHHTHPDGINVLAGTREGERLVGECFGDEAAWIPYIRPGFMLAKQVGMAVRENPDLRLVVLAKHGLVVWGDSAEEAYRRTVEVINRAVGFVNARTAGLERFDGPAGEARPERLAALLPALRGAVSSERAKVLVVDQSPRVMEFVSSRAAPALTDIGAACPDHLVHTKRLPLWIPFDADRDSVRERAAAYREAYREYGDADPDARVVLIENVGLVGVGTSTKAAGLSRDLYHRAIEVMAGAHALGGFVSLDRAESHAIEYWPLELYKLSLAPAPGELQGQVALVTGAAGGIGRAVVDSLASAGASVVAFDLDEAGAREAADVAVGGDVTSEADVARAFAAAVEAYGGVDIVVSNAGVASSAAIEETTLAEWERNHAILGTGYFLVAREAFRVLREQNCGGSIVFVASKNSLVAGKNAAAYSSAKAAELHLARCLAEEGGAAGIRVNTVNPDAVLQGSRIWDSSWREQRAAAYGIQPDELEEHYRKRTTLGVNILPEDIAEAVLHFASPRRSGKSTGNVLNVDGGVPAAYPR